MNISYSFSSRNNLLELKTSKWGFLLMMVLFFGLFGNVATAQKTWDGGAGTSNWGDSNNWNPNGVPASTDAVTLTNNATVTVDISTAVCASLQLGGTANNKRGMITFAATGSPKLTVTGAVTMGGNSSNVNRSGTITFVSGSTLLCDSLTLGNINNSPSILTMSANSTLQTGSLVVGGTGTTWTPSTGTVILTATNTLPNTKFTSFNNLTINSGTTTATVGLSIAGVLNLAASTTLNMSTFAMTGAFATLGTGVLRVQNTSGIPLPTGRVWSGTVQYDGVGQTVVVGTYNNLTISGSGIKTAAGNIIANDDFTLTAGTFVLNNGTSYTLTVGGDYLQTGGMFDFNSGTSGTSTMNISGNLTNTVPTTDSMTTSGSGTPNGKIVFNGSSIQNINYTVPKASIWTTYTINTGSSVKFVSNITLEGASSDPKYYSDFIVNGIIDFGDFILSESSTNGSHFTLNSGAGLITTNVDGIAASAALGSIQVKNTRTFSTTASYTYNGSAAQVVGTGLPATVNNLTISNSSGVTLLQATAINNNFSINSGAIANLGTGFTHTAGNLSLGGFVASSGSWGSTTSSATYINNTYFDATTGIVNIGTSSCSSPIVYSITGSGNFCAGSAGSPIGLSDSDIGVSYQLIRNRVNVGSVVAGTGNSISFGLHNSAGDYTVVATRNSTFCSATMTGVVRISSLPPLPVGTAIVNTGCSASTGSITLANQNHGLEFVKTTSQYISTTTPFLSNLNTFTMEGWIKYRTSDLNASFTSLFGQNDVIEFGFQGGQLHLYTENGGNIYATPPANLGDNTWHHIAAVGTGSQILIYVDGVVAGSGGSVTGNYGSHTDNVNIGAGVFNPTGDFFAGQIMKVGFYNTALSGIRIASLAYSPIIYTGTETGLIAGYNFLEGSGTTLTSLPAGKNGTLVNAPIWRDPYIYSWTKTGTPTYTATTRNVTGLSSGSYNLSFDIGKGCSRTVSYSVSPTNVYNGSWSLGTPTPDQNIEFTGPYNVATDITACACTVTSGAITILAGNYLKLGGKLTVNTPGTLTFENNASLVQTTFTGANTGVITYKRGATTNKEMDYTYWSSPVALQNLLAISPTTKLDKFFSFDAAADNWMQVDPTTTEMAIGKGYIIRGIPQPSNPIPPGLHTALFIGEPNNGLQSIAVASGIKSNLIGNPYPSAIYADQFLYDNQLVIDGTIYFWTHNTPIAIGTPDPGTGAWAYSGNDYASYSLTGGVGTGLGKGNTIPGTPPTENVSNRPTGKIAAGQSFFTTSTAGGGTVNFTNAMRVDGSGNPLNNSNFYKTKNPKAKTSTTIEKNRVWLNLTNAKGAFKQTLVGYITGATNTWDNLYDGESFDGNNFLDFYSINDEKNLTIQGRALPFDANDEIPLGYRIAVEGSFTISIGETDGSLINQDIFLEDKMTNTTVNLKEGNYAFSTKEGTFDNRFVLRYTDKTLGTTDFDVKENSVLVSVKNKQIKVNSFGENIDKVTIFDLLGRQIYQKDKVNSNELSVANVVSSHQILIVKTTLQNGKVVAGKIVY